MFEILGAPPRPRRRPVRRYYGPRYAPVYYPYSDTRVIEVERSEPVLPWRVTSYNSGGQSVLFQSASMADAVKFYKDKSKTWKSTKVGFNTNLNLQRWTGSGWKTEATMNSQDWLSRR